jgi:hypothetical protein
MRNDREILEYLVGLTNFLRADVLSNKFVVSAADSAELIFCSFQVWRTTIEHIAFLQ